MGRGDEGILCVLGGAAELGGDLVVVGAVADGVGYEGFGLGWRRDGFV